MMSRQNFVLVESTVVEIPKLLLEKVEGFAHSEEFLRHQEWENTPGVICGAFAIYVSRIHRDGESSTILDSAFSAIEKLAAIRDSNIDTLIVTEILENIYFREFPELVRRLGPKSRALYDHWLA